jgi:hypothetical protein
VHGGLPEGVGEPGGQHLAGRRFGFGGPWLRVGVLGVRLDVEDQLHEIRPGDAVDHAVVDLRDERPAVALEALDEPDLPQRLRHVQALAEHAAGEVAQLLGAARAGDGGVPHVVEDLEVLVVHPQWAAELERYGADPLPVARHLRELAQQQPDDVPVGRRRSLEDRHRAHVHGRVRALGVEEAGVGRAHPFHGHHLPFRHGINCLATRVGQLLRSAGRASRATYSSMPLRLRLTQAAPAAAAPPTPLYAGNPRRGCPADSALRKQAPPRLPLQLPFTQVGPLFQAS